MKWRACRLARHRQCLAAAGKPYCEVLEQLGLDLMPRCHVAPAAVRKAALGRAGQQSARIVTG